MNHLENTWCYATEETKKALNIISPISQECYYLSTAYDRLFVININIDYCILVGAKEVHLVNGEFQYVNDN